MLYNAEDSTTKRKQNVVMIIRTISLNPRVITTFVLKKALGVFTPHGSIIIMFARYVALTPHGSIIIMFTRYVALTPHGSIIIMFARYVALTPHGSTTCPPPG